MLEQGNTYCRERIEAEAKDALAEANWYAEHIVRFLEVTPRNDDLFFVDSVRRSERFYRQEWSPEDVTEQAHLDYIDALTIVANIEKIVRTMGCGRSE